MRESYAQDLLSGLDVEAIRARGYRIVVDYGYSATSYVLPLLLGPLGVEAVSAHGFAADGVGADRRACVRRSARRSASSTAIGADLGVVFDRAGERLFLIDEQAHEIPVEQTLLAVPAPDELERPATASSPSRSPSRARSTSWSRAATSR